MDAVMFLKLSSTACLCSVSSLRSEYCYAACSVLVHSTSVTLPSQDKSLTSADSLLYLPLADATVITFLAPSLACWACSFLINEPFTRMEQIAAYVSLFGVVLIARPISLFAALSHSEKVPPASGDGDMVPSNTTVNEPGRLASDYDAVTPTQRATAVGIAMLGVLGAAGAYTTIRWIGKRAHPLISVNYFATWCTIVSIIAMLTLPGVGFLLPRYFRDWCYLIFLGICGFVMVCSPPSSSENRLTYPAISSSRWFAVREVVSCYEHGLYADALRTDVRQIGMGYNARCPFDHRIVVDLGVSHICCNAQRGSKKASGRGKRRWRGGERLDGG